MKKSIHFFLLAIAVYFVTLLLCFISGYILTGTTHVLAWHEDYKNALFYVPLVMFIAGLAMGIGNYDKTIE